MTMFQLIKPDNHGFLIRKGKTRPRSGSFYRRVGLPLLTVVFAAVMYSGAAGASNGMSSFSDLEPMTAAEAGVSVSRETTGDFADRNGLTAMSDSEMSEVSGQALFQTQKITGQDTVATGSLGYTYYRVGLDTQLDLNMNIENLELGRTGPDNWPANPFDVGAGYPYGSYTPNVDIWGKNLALGCTADSGGNCVSSASATQLKPLTLLRPYFEFAIKNDGTQTQREVVGIRLGAENISGPLSFGQMRSFSGYLTATAQLTMEGMTDVAATCGTDALGATGGGQTLFAPYSGGCGPNGLAGTGANVFSGTHNTTNTDEINISNTEFQYTVTHLLSGSYNGTRGSLGLDNQQVCDTTFGLCAWLSDLTANFSTRSTSVLDARANGKRLTQAYILNPGLATLIDNVASTLTINQCEAGFTVCTGGSWFPALVRGPSADAFKSQVCTGLGLGTYGVDCSDAELNTAQLPFNLSNFHQVDVNSSNIGLTFQRENLRYPGYDMAAVMRQGWSMYLPDAFFISVSQPAGVLTNNIANGAAGRGDLVSLPAAYDNCWGNATFC